MFKNFWKNLKTTLAGSVAGGAMIIDGCAAKDVLQVLAGIGVVLVGLFSKDQKKTDVKILDAAVVPGVV